jgi:hypothetical protein
LGGVRIGHLDRSGLALADDGAGLAPGAALLPGVPSVPQRVHDRPGAHLWQPIRGFAHRPLQRRKRPGCRPIPLPIRRPAKFLDDPLPLDCSVPDGRATAMLPVQCSEPHCIEARHQVGHGVARPAASGLGSVGVPCAIGHREQRLRASHPIGPVAPCPADTLQLGPLVGRQRPQRVFLSPTHDPSPSLSLPYDRLAHRKPPERPHTR